ncbi:hypothetical protein KUV51_20630 [Tateyamaria omphalii]|uniref:hypothetical protein n=1 Tax=Tateyamaria omphalii TaxID=299262 RepID=UPI001C997C62|nr:hypothetical protein [Tateyamaria omphalii]MBY5935425.1 hypothetical protein [Tateyamaria omphalii]
MMVALFWMLIFPVIVGWWVARSIRRRYGTGRIRIMQTMIILSFLALTLAAFQAMYLHGGAILSPARNIHAFGPDGATDEIWSQFLIVFPLTLLGLGLSFLRRQGQADPGGASPQAKGTRP